MSKNIYSCIIIFRVILSFAISKGDFIRIGFITSQPNVSSASKYMEIGYQMALNDGINDTSVEKLEWELI